MVERTKDGQDMTEIDENLFRRALGCFASGVTIVTNRSSWPSAVVWRCVPIATHAHCAGFELGLEASCYLITRLSS